MTDTPTRRPNQLAPLDHERDPRADRLGDRAYLTAEFPMSDVPTASGAMSPTNYRVRTRPQTMASDPSVQPVAPRKAVNRPRLRTNKRIRHEKDRLQRRITKAEKRGDTETATYLQALYLKSFHVARDAVIATSKKAPPHRRLNAEDQLSLAERINVHAPCDEPVTRRDIPKKNGARTIHAYGTEGRVRQRITRSALTAIAADTIGPNQYAGLPGRGRNKLIDDLCIALRRRAATKSGKAAKGRYHFTHFAVLDIKDAFGSMVMIVEYLVENAYLPRAVADYVIGCAYENYVIRSPQEVAAHAADRPGTPHNRHERRSRSQMGSRLRRHMDRITPRGVGPDVVPTSKVSVPSIQVDFHSAKHGLPQGAATSSIAAEIAIADILATITLPNGVTILVFADDLIVLGRSSTDVTAAITALCSGFRRARVGTLELTIVAQGRITKGFNFLGYHFRRRNGRLIAKPIPNRVVGLMAKLYATVIRMEAGVADRRDDLRRLVRSWRMAFKVADTTDTIAWMLLGAQHAARTIPTRVVLGNLMREVGSLA